MSPALRLTEYERQRQLQVEENMRQMEALGLKDLKKELSANKPKPKVQARRVSKSPGVRDGERRASMRVAEMPDRPSYRDMDGDHSARGGNRGGGDHTRNPAYLRAFVSTKEAQEADDAATAAAGKLSQPCMVKRMVRSHISGCFWLGLSSNFCKEEMGEADTKVMLEDEDGRTWETIYKSEKTALSGGWRGFSIDHKLDAGDALIFEVMSQSRLKVHIFRASDMPAAVKAGVLKVVLDPKDYVYASDLYTVRAKERRLREPKEEGSEMEEDEPKKSGPKKGAKGEGKNGVVALAQNQVGKESKKSKVKVEKEVMEEEEEDQEEEEEEEVEEEEVVVVKGGKKSDKKSAGSKKKDTQNGIQKGGEEKKAEQTKGAIITQQPAAEKGQRKRTLSEIVAGQANKGAKDGAEVPRPRGKGAALELVLSDKRRKTLRRSHREVRLLTR
eukprot:TRINITY_DN3433_c0_g1_i2.p1 TRINITY_DN3433_c0_g1~~TRINITY_DN3433_c0_g1_i2.p1  ORF type:complete len:444 (-),score=132.14 TRINITY_DN3433_c0_g1_i2:329-1660(-)